MIGDHHTTRKNLSKTSILILFKTCATFWGVFLFVFFVIKLNCIYFVLLILSKGTVSQRGGFKYRFHKFAHGCIVEPAVIPPKKMDDAPTQQLLKSTPVTGEQHIKGKSR